MTAHKLPCPLHYISLPQIRLYPRYEEGLIAAPILRASQFEKEVTTMIKKIQQFLLPQRGKRSSRRQFNRPLLEKQREDVFVLLHQHVGGLR
jgi:hypothetical protein